MMRSMGGQGAKASGAQVGRADSRVAPVMADYAEAAARSSRRRASGVQRDLRAQRVEPGEPPLRAQEGVQRAPPVPRRRGRRRSRTGGPPAGSPCPALTVGRRPILATPVRSRAVRQARRHRVDAARRLQMPARARCWRWESRWCARARRRAPPRRGSPRAGRARPSPAPDSRPATRGGCGWRRSGRLASAERRHHGQPDAQRLGARGQEADVAAAAVAEGEIGAADQMLRAEARVQHLGDERPRRSSG